MKVLINIRKAIIDDLENIIAFMSNKDLIDKDVYNESDFYVYYDNNILLGYGISVAKGEYCIIENIIVHESYRKNKIGTAIAKTIINAYECRGAKYAISYGRCSGFCESLGFYPISQDDLPTFIRNIPFISKNKNSLYGVSLDHYFKNCC